MVDKKNLSKRKYIYKIYKGKDAGIYYERCPVIYINSELVYYKQTGNDPYLKYETLNRVYDYAGSLLFENMHIIENYNQHYFYELCWEIGDEAKETIKEISAEQKKESTKAKRELKKKSLYQTMTEREESYKKSKERYEAFLNECEKDEE